MTNINCLEGIACRQCGNDSRINIAVKTLAVVTDQGAETFGDMDWGEDSYAECPECHHRSTVAGFRIEATTKTTTQTTKEKCHE